MTERIKEIWKTNREVYGAPRIHAELRMAHGIKVSRKRVERLMREAGISGLVARKRGRTTIRVPGVRVADDLVERDFQPAAPNLLWVADITYLRTWEGWLYLAAVQDAFSRRIVGWSMADHMRSELVVDALQMGIARRRPKPGLVHHSDQGSQFVSLAFGQAAGEAGIARSMGSRGDCFDNAVAESFFATLKKELVHRRSWPTAGSSAPRSSPTSRPSTTAPADTPRWGCSLPLSSRMNISLTKRKRSTTTRLAPQAQLCPLGRGKSKPIGQRHRARSC